MTEVNIEPIVADENEKADLAKLAQILNMLNNGHSDRKLQILDGETGETIPMPQCILQLLRQVVHQFNQGKGVVIETFHQPLTINEAAYLLNFSRQHMVEILQNGEIPSTGEGLNRKIQFDHLIDYQKNWAKLRHKNIRDIAQMSHDAGLYFLGSELSEPTAKISAE
ncbi:helix-turn-helix domain-containing protein [Planktothricoides raciborskii]|uniref:Helix-turn-helix domain-containing protein n=1 Tax=Planktothricoides raciborskii GIHE-MW2 TaxID=2792601 RepID=A0AAU8JFW2_9CYAN